MEPTTDIADFEDPDEEPDPDEILGKAIAGLDRSYELVYVDYRDQLDDDQIRNALAGNYEQVDHSIWEFADEARRESSWQVAENLVSDDVLSEEELEVLRCSDGDQMSELLIAIEERDSSDPMADLLRHTGSHLLRFKLDYELAPDSWNWTEDETEEAMREIAEETGLDYEANRGALSSLVANATYGGQLYVLWTGDVQEIAEPVLQMAYGNDPDGSYTITWRDPTLLVLDRMNGSGMDAAITGEITRPLTIGSVEADDIKGAGYSWTETTGGVRMARGDVSVRKSD